MKILVLTTEPLPLPQFPTTGAGLRAWGLGLGLRSAGFDDVQFGFAADAIRGTKADLSAFPFVHTFERARLGDFIESQSPEAVVLQHWGLANDLPPLDCPLAIDLAGPHLLERALWGSRKPQEDLREKLTALSRADYVVCSGQFQRHYFLPYLLQAGFAPEADICPVIPFSLSPELPVPAPDRDLSRFLFAGFFLPWQNPRATIDWTLESFNNRDKGQLVVVGGGHPSGDISGGSHEELLARIESDAKAERHAAVPFDQLLQLALNCGGAVDLMPRNPERELAFPTRTVFYMWAGLPVLHNDYDELAEPIRRARAGWALDPENKRDYQRVIERLVGHTEDIERRSEKAQHLVRQHFTWDKTIKPLAEWCRDPKPRKNKRAAIIPVETTTASPRPDASKRTTRGRITYSPPLPVAGPNRLQQVLSPLAMLLALPIALVLLVFFGVAELVKIIRGR